MLRTVGSDSTVNNQATTRTVNRTRVEKVNTQLVARLVGFLEYRQALAHLDRLLNVVSAAELDAIEQIVCGRDEFVVHTDMARRFDSNRNSGAQFRYSSSQGGRRGLGWVMALARVELGAMIAGFTDRPHPFHINRPSRYELPQYQDILLDSMRTHYLALQNDSVVQQYVNWAGRPLALGYAQFVGDPRFSEGQAIAYPRRVSIACEFVEAAQQLMGQNNAAQQGELQHAKSELVALQNTILYRILGLGTSVSTTSQSSRANLGGTRMASCPRLLQIARQDLAAGRAKVRPIFSIGQE